MSTFTNAKGLKKGNKKIALKYVFFNNVKSNQKIKLDKKCFISECCIKNAVLDTDLIRCSSFNAH